MVAGEPAEDDPIRSVGDRGSNQIGPSLLNVPGAMEIPTSYGFRGAEGN